MVGILQHPQQYLYFLIRPVLQQQSLFYFHIMYQSVSSFECLFFAFSFLFSLESFLIVSYPFSDAVNAGYRE